MATVGTSQPSSTTGAGQSPVSNDERWESILTDGFASAGIDTTRDVIPDGDGTYAASEPAAAPQSDASSPVPEAPQATGDDGAPTAAPSEQPAAPDAQAPEGQPEPDIDLTNATPFTYQTADGKQAAIDGTYRIPGEGLVVPEAAVPQIERLATEREQYAAKVRELEQQRDTYERLTAWPTKDQQGRVSTLTGIPALEQRALLMRRTFAAATAMGQVFDDPEKLARLVTAQLGQDGQVYLVPNAEALDALKVSIKAAALEAELAERQQFARSSAPPPPPEPTVQSRAMPTVEQTVAALKVQGLTEQDKQYLAAHVGRFVRAATPDEQRQGLGKHVMDEAWQAFVTDRATMRADAMTAAKVAERAGKFNAGMNQPKPKPQTRPAAPQPTSQPTDRPKGKQAAWDAVLTQALAEMRPTGS